METTYRVFIKYCVFSLKCCDFSEPCQSCCTVGFYLPGLCTHTETEGKHQRKSRVQNILKSSEKNTIFNEHHVDKAATFSPSELGSSLGS